MPASMPTAPSGSSTTPTSLTDYRWCHVHRRAWTLTQESSNASRKPGASSVRWGKDNADEGLAMSIRAICSNYLHRVVALRWRAVPVVWLLTFNLMILGVGVYAYFWGCDWRLILSEGGLVTKVDTAQLVFAGTAGILVLMLAPLGSTATQGQSSGARFWGA